MSRFRNITFTLNNPVGLPDPQADGLFELHSLSYMVFSEEVGETGTHHLQGYMEFSKQLSLAQLQALPGLEGAHFEPRRGTQAQAIAYCKKLDDPTFIAGPYEWGAPKEQGERRECSSFSLFLLGERRDLSDLRSRLDDGASLAVVSREFFGDFLRYGRGITAYKNLHARPRDFKTLVILVVGPSGVGKSYFARRLLAPALSFALSGTCHDVFTVSPPKGSGLYWDNYVGQSVTVLDEFDGYYMPPTSFNQLADAYEHAVPVHGQSNVQFTSRVLIVVSNYLPKFWWKKRSSDQIYQTTRRLDLVLPFLLPRATFLARHDRLVSSDPRFYPAASESFLRSLSFYHRLTHPTAPEYQ